MTRNRKLGTALAAFAFVMGTVAVLSPARALTNCDVSAADLAVDAEEARMLDLVNDYRARNGLNALSLQTDVTRGAAWFSRDMATNDYFPYNHVDRFGRDIGTRLRQCDAVFTSWAENIAAGNATAERTFEQWRTSPSHNTNMLLSGVTTAGIARAFDAAATYDWYWTLDLTDGSTRVSSPTTSAPTTMPAPTTTLSTPTTIATPTILATPTTIATVPPLAADVPASTATVPAGPPQLPALTPDGSATADVPRTPDATEVTGLAEVTDVPGTTASAQTAPAVLPTVCAMLQALAADTGGRMVAVQQALGGTLGLGQLAGVTAYLAGVQDRITADIDAARTAAGCSEPALDELDLLTAATAS